VYQVGALATINGQPIPEVGTWLPLVGALGLFVMRRPRRAVVAQ
jgi:MYXO-CTERM domain-containing protein